MGLAPTFSDKEWPTGGEGAQAGARIGRQDKAGQATTGQDNAGHDREGHARTRQDRSGQDRKGVVPWGCGLFYGVRVCACVRWAWSLLSCKLLNDTEGIRTPAGRAQWILSPSP